MSVNVKQNGDLTKVANNISIVQANWNDINNTDKNTCIKNQPETLTTMEEITANTNENALAGANAVKELNNSLGDLLKVVVTTNSTAITIDSGKASSVSFTADAPSGYTRLGIIGALTGNSNVVIASFGTTSNGSSTSSCMFRNIHTSAQTIEAGKAYIRVLYIKNN